MLQCNRYAETLNGRRFRLVLRCDAGCRSRRNQFRNRMKWASSDSRGRRRDFGFAVDRNIVNRNRLGIVKAVLLTGRQPCHGNQKNQDRHLGQNPAKLSPQS
jgi:hypothetical protein